MENNKDIKRAALWQENMHSEYLLHEYFEPDLMDDSDTQKAMKKIDWKKV